VPAGYGGPSVVSFGGAVSYEPTSAGKLSSHRESDRADSTLDIPRGTARFEVLESLSARVGINPSMRTSSGYERVVDLHLTPAR
jgi:hypothetical protein